MRGRNLSNLLSSLGAKLQSFVRSKNDATPNKPGTTVILGDVQDYQSLLEALKGVDVAFHLAAITLIPETRAKTFNAFSTPTILGFPLGQLYIMGAITAITASITALAARRSSRTRPSPKRSYVSRSP